MNWILAAALANAHRETYSGQINQMKKNKKLKYYFKVSNLTNAHSETYAGQINQITKLK